MLWRQDIDLAGVEDVTLLRELEKSEEMRLHDKQEEVGGKMCQLVLSSRFDIKIH